MPFYLCQTKVKSERKAKVHLERQGYETCLPEHKRSPLFPGYLFVYVNEDQMISPCKNTQGVQRLVGFGENAPPMPVSEHIIQELMSTVHPGIEPFPTDSTVRIRSGPFKHLEGIVKVRKADRIFIVMKMMQLDQVLELSIEAVEAA